MLTSMMRKREAKRKLTIRIARPCRGVGEAPQIQHLAHRQVEETCPILRDGQLRETSSVGGRQFALGNIWVRV